jgi:hypothetical protein
MPGLLTWEPDHFPALEVEVLTYGNSMKQSYGMKQEIEKDDWVNSDA